MQLISSEKLITIMERALNLIDPRLVDHGKRVAYRLFRALHPLGVYDDAGLRDICMLGLFHDIGAYKTEDIDSILCFDTENNWDHSVYGYLFIKYFSPIKSMAPVILFHHAHMSQMTLLNEEHRNLTQILKNLDSEDVEQIIKNQVCKDCTYIDEDAEFIRVFRKTPFSSEAMEAYIKMIVFSIDFRSPQTMIHTFAAAHAAEFIARLAKVDKSEIESLKTGAMLHDIGKMGTPLHILEGTKSGLSHSDMKIMKNHVVLSRDVLVDCVNEEVLNIAANHHERMNGKGYPRGLNGASQAYLDRLMAVADVFSAMCVSRSYQKALSKEKAVQVLRNMGNQNLLDKSIVDLAINNYDEIVKFIDISSKPVIAAYEDIAKESNLIHSEKNNNSMVNYRC